MEHSFNKVIDLLFQARKDGVEVLLNEGRLQLKVREGKKIDEKLLAEIRNNKQAIIDYLANNELKAVNVADNQTKINAFNRQEVEHIPASFSQERLWFIDQLGGSLEYHSTSVLRLTGKLNLGALEFALRSVVERHEVLRTVFYEMGGQVYQSVKDISCWALAVQDGSRFNDNPEQLHAFIERSTKQAFDLAKDLPTRALLIKLGDEEHVLAVTLHHIASDAWSTGIIVREVAELYRSYIEGQPANLPELPLQFADFAMWQRNYLKGDVLNRKIEYWKHKLEGHEPLQLPADNRPAVKSNRGASISFKFDKEISAKLHDLCQQKGVSMYMLLLSLYKVLLYRYSGQSDITVGTSIASRQQKDLEGLIGFFVNTLALRDEVDGKASFADLLQQVKATALGAYEHQNIPFEKVVEVAARDRDAGRSPLFQVMLVLANTPQASKFTLHNLEFSYEAYQEDTTKFEITFFINETPDGLQGSVQYSTDLYSAATIQGMISHFKVLMASAVANPQQKVALLPMLGETEEEQLTSGINQNKTDYPKDKTIVELFEQQAAKTPQATAVVFEDSTLTYQQLNEAANQLAHHLQSKGIQPGTLVPLYMHRGADMITGILGILKAGCAYVPVDTDFPAERIRYMLSDTDAKFVVADTSTKNNLPPTVQAITLDDASEQPTTNNQQQSTPAATAYVIYTSGSTGNPKGVLVSHRNLVDYYVGLDEQIHISDCKSFALVSTIATDLGNTVLYASLLSGGALHVFTKEAVSNIEYLHSYFANNNVECVKIVPSHWKALTNGNSFLLPKKLIVFGGEALQAEDVMAIAQQNETCRVVNHYGPTETTIGKLCHEVQFSHKYNKTIPIGKPFGNTNVYVLTKNLQVCPVGVAGQLYISGDGVAQGYLNNETLTREKFIDDPFSLTKTKMYGTGDLVKWLSDGNIEFIGRADDQVKIRGYRVELGEIESILQQSGLVKQAVVLARAAQQGNKRLVGYVVPSGYFDREEVMDYLQKKLPEYMIPQVLVNMEEMPMMANGKIDRKALPDPDVAELLSEKYVAPRNETETQLAAIWADVLEVDEVGMNDDFFELGGHSLLAVRLVSAIRKAFGVEMPIGDIFDYPTVGLLAEQLSNNNQKEVLPPVTPITEKPQQIPLSFSQERLWFIDRLGGSLQYHIPSVLRLTGNLNIDALQHAIQQVVKRHEVLRTIINDEAGTGYQQVQGWEGWKLQIIDNQLYNKDAQALQQYIKQNIEQPFDLGNDYMLRATLVKLEDQQHILIATLHHIASDGWSTSIMVQELAELYNSFVENKQAQLPQLPVQYADYALWQRTYLQGETWDKKLDYWKQKLSDTAALQIPTDYKRPPVQSTRGALSGFRLSKEVSEGLNQLSQKHGATLFMTLLAAFKVLMYRYSGQNDICVGTPIAGRQQSELEGLIGFFVNTLALRTQVNGNDSFEQLLAQVRTTTLEAYDHQEVPFEKVVELTVKDRDMSRSPLFQVMFVLQNTPEVEALKLGEIALRMEAEGSSGHTTAKFDITLYITETPSGLSVAFEYCTDLFKKSSINKMMAHFEVLINSIIAAPQHIVDSIYMMAPGEEELLTQKFNDTKADYCLEKTVIDFFKDQAAQTPNSAAIIHNGKEFTYEYLSQQSCSLLKYLQGKGVQQGSYVPVCMPRGVNMIVAILAILKAGAAYVPIDVDYPADRIDFILEDTGASTVLSEKAFEHLFAAKGEIQAIYVDALATNDLVDAKLLPTAGASDVICLAYTSGSTGKPKGVQLTHTGISNRLQWMWQQYPFEPGERNVIKTSIGFVDHAWEIFGALCKGVPSVIISKEELTDTDVLVSKLKKENVSRIVLVPSLLKTIIGKLQAETDSLPALKYCTCSGEALSLNLVKDFYTVFPLGNHRLLNIYGSSEVSADVTCYDTSLNSHWQEPNSSLQYAPIGSPISNTQLYILDKHDALVTEGVAGEICITGAPVTKGYLNLPELTEARFVQNSFGEGLMFKTGDFGRWLEDGVVEYLGRVDDQVKIRGNRVELGEVETALKQSGFVTDCVVVAKPDRDGNNTLVAYVVADGAIDRQALTAGMREKLPEFMVPYVWIQLDELPLTSSGKINRRALPEPISTNLVSNEYVAPQNETEEKLTAIWQNLLKLDRISVIDNFFELGGHSLLAMRMVSAIRKEFDADISIRTIFVHTTITKLAAYIHDRLNEALFPPVTAIPERPAHIPLSFSQERLWFIDRLGGSLQYHIPSVLRLTGTLNIDALQHAIQQVVKRHEVLRTIINNEAGTGCQQVQGWEGWKLEIIDNQLYNEDAAALQQYIKQNIEQPFDLGKDYMLRATLVKLEDQQHILVATLHHIASDGWSTSIMVKELAELYNSFTQNKEAQLPQLPVQYADYALWQRTYLQGEAWDKKLDYWKQKLSDTAALQIPTDYKRPPVQSTRGAISGFRLSKEVSDGLNQLSQKHGATLFMTLLAAFKVLMYRYSGQSDICVGTPIAGRQQSELEGLIGFFVNTLALRTQVNGSDSFEDLLQQVRTTTLEAYDNQEVPFEKVVELAVKDRDMSRSPLFQVMFVLQNTPEVEALKLGEVKVARAESETLKHVSSKYDLTFYMLQAKDGLHITIEYCSDLFAEASINKLYTHFVNLVNSIAGNASESIGMLPMLSADENQQLLHGFNNQFVSYPETSSIVELFEQQVVNNPQKTALLFETETLTYNKLNEQANKLARFLQGKGVTSGMMIPVVAENGVELIVAILAILKTGCSYVPIDSSYPAERIAFMLKDIDAQLVLAGTNKLAKLPAGNNIEVVNLKDILSGLDMPATNLDEQVLPGSLANIIYTSGSTGKPKGVMVTHRNVVSLVKNTNYVSLSKADVLLATGSPSFDATTFEYWSMLLNGGTLVLSPEASLLDINYLKKEIVARKANIMWFTSSWFNQLADADISIFKPLSTILVGGEKLSAYHINKVKTAYPAIDIINGYGPTENTTFSLTWHIKQTADDLLPIGKPLQNRTAIIVNEQNQLVPIGVAGEICVGGAGLANGYLNNPELTAEKFIDHPFAERNNERLYKTGDIGYWLPDGNVVYVGRKDEQVKIRGFRIEPGEIESVIKQSDMIADAAVVARVGVTGDKYLSAYVIPEKSYNKQEVTTWLQSRLPSYMVPSKWLELEQFPLTRNGKTDKARLPEPDLSRVEENEYVAPRNELEKKLVAIWEDLLKIEKVSIHDNFFELGGHSLYAIRLVWQISQKMNIDIPVNNIFIYPTVASLINNYVDKITNPSLPQVNIRYLVPVKTTGTKPPLYFIAGGGGTALKIKKFAEMLDADQPVYVLQPPIGGKPLKEFPATIEGIAKAFIEEIQVLNPDGPYSLSGHCLGGIIALEMAKQLQQQDKKVSFLAFFDTIIRKKVEQLPATFQNLYHIPALVQRQFKSVMLKVDFQTFMLRKHTLQSFKYKVANVRSRLNKMRRKNEGTNGLEYAGLEVFNESSDLYSNACRNYRITPYSGKIVLFYAKERYFFLDASKSIGYKKIHLDEETKYNWQEYASEIKVYDVNGEHSDIFDPVNGEEFARILQQNLNER